MFIIGEQSLKSIPSSRPLKVEEIKVERNDPGVEIGKEPVDSFSKLVRVQFGGKSPLDRALSVVLDPHPVTESYEEWLLKFHEPDLKKVLSNGVTPTKLQSLVHPGNLVRDRLFLNEDGTQFAGLCQTR